MQEFSSVTASSYDADALAPLLNEKSAEGWDVVSIVSAGSNIVAYLSRESDGSATAATPDTTDTTDTTEAADSTPDATTEESSAPSLGDDTGAAVAAGAAGAAGAAAASEPTAEPAGWATAPEPTAEQPAATSDDSVADLAAQVGAGEESTPAAAEPATTEPAAAEQATTQQTAAEPAAEQAAPAQQPAADAVPAGWYADPSGRFELRYWDGGAWTEHVSRAGQQFTDPPVA